MTLFLVAITLGYLMGSICSAVIVCRTFNLPDPRQEGSKNPGATNVLRIAGKQYAALVMVVDLLKGTIPVLIAKALGASPAILAFTALAAVVGHMYPVFFGFKGGKGVATAIGALLGFHFMVGIMVAATWLLVANFSRYSSLASLVAIVLSPLYALLMIPQLDIFPPLFFMVILIVFKHKNNITRLMDGTEPKIKFKHSVIEEVMHSPHTEAPDAHETSMPTISPADESKIVAPKTIKSTQTKKVSAVKEKPAALKKKTPAKPAKTATKKSTAEKPIKKATTAKPKITKVTE